MKLLTAGLPVLLAAALAGCATALPTPPEPPASGPAVPAAWQAPLPHGGQSADLDRWWSQFDDPLLVRLVQAAQAASPTLASAAARLTEARAARTAAAAALLPRLDASAALLRGRVDLGAPALTSASAGLQASWELDVFGAAGASRDGAQARLEGAEAGWHEARVLVAAEAAQAYVGLRACEAQRGQAEADAQSRRETARLTGLAEKAGFQSPANAALARASAAQGQSQLAAQRAACDQQIKALVALTALEEAALRTELAARTAQLPQPARLAVASVPAQWLAQRPDLAAAERQLAAAAADARAAQAQRWPRVALAGQLTPTRVSAAGFTQDGTLWQLGPLQLSLPLFDGGRLAAGEQAARARYDEAAAAYRARLRQAMREVESALVVLASAEQRAADVQQAADDFQRALRGTDSRYRAGLASLFELEDARRSALAARSALIDLQRERVAAWVSLYQALGGGWQAGQPTTLAAAATAGPAPAPAVAP